MTRQRFDASHIAQTVNPARLPEFTHRFKHYGCSITFHPMSNKRYSYWRIEDDKTGDVQTLGFDTDLESILRQLANGQRLVLCSVIPQSASVATSTSGTTNRCAVCGEVGGLPCPAMLNAAIADGFVLKLSPAEVAKNACHMHPGRCRKRVRAHLDASKQARGVS